MASDIGELSSITLLLFLNTHKNSLGETDLLQRLNVATTDILENSYDSALHVLLNRNGWDESTSSFKPSELDIETLASSLRLFIERRRNKASASRASQVDVTNRIKSFAPDLLMNYTLERNARNEKRKLEPFSIFFDGVCLLADISGFTRLSGKFCEGGRDGIDQLQQVVNGYLGQLVKIVYAYGGDVMKFAGDALVCVFQPNRQSGADRASNVADACSNAVQCATELAQICTEQLTLHVAVSCGPICFAMLGGHENIWECLVSGSCLGDLSQCLEDAASKQTVVSPEIVKSLGKNYRKEINMEQLSSGNYLVISTVKVSSLLTRKMIKRRGEMLMKDGESRFVMFPNDDSFLRTIGLFVPMPVTTVLNSGTFDYLAELREVTTMFMSWDSYSHEDHNDLLRLQLHFLAAQKVLSESGGFIRQFLIDDKGCVLIACWGVPTASHPDNTRRALCSGAAIGYKLNELGMKTSVGITTGNVFCGSVGSHIRREYAVIGDVVNLAARLMSKAKGGLFLDEATYSRIPLFLQEHLQKLAPMSLKGKDVPITAYSLKKGMKEISLNDKGEGEIHVGILSIRPACKGPLLKGMQRIKSAEPVRLNCIVLEGKAGTGKVEVVDWLRLTGQKMDIRVVSLSAMAVDCTSKYRLVARLFRMLVREAIFDDVASQSIVVKQILRHVYKTDTETIEKVAYPAVKEALGVTTSSTRKLPKRVLDECLFSIFLHLLNLCPLVIVIENIHLADSASWDILLDLMGKYTYALVVITIEPLEDLKDEMEPPTGEIVNLEFNRLSRNYKTMTRFKTTSVVMMNDYSVLDVAKLLCTVLNVEICPEGVSILVHQISGGDPFWCREMAQFIQISGTEEFSKAMSCSRGFDYDIRYSQCVNHNFLYKHNEAKRGGSFIKTVETSLMSPRQGSGSSKAVTTPGKRKASHVVHKVSRELDGVESPYNGEEEGRIARSETVAKLELFIVCRLETLSREDQNILRTASIIGRNFSSEILYGILSPKLRTQMFDSVLSLVKSQWIIEIEASRGVSSTEYSFVHPLFYHTLYNLTPAGDKAVLHSAVACYLEAAHRRSPLYYAQLGRHFGLARDCRPKALEYFVRASVYCLSSGMVNYDEGLELLAQARIFADSALDFGTILGVVIDRSNKLCSAKKRLMDINAPVKIGKNSSSPFRSNKVQAATTATATSTSTSVVRRSSLDGLAEDSIDRYQIILADMEIELTRLYEEMEKINCVGVVTDWQRPYLIKWKESISHNDNGLRKTSTVNPSDPFKNGQTQIPIKNKIRLKIKSILQKLLPKSWTVETPRKPEKEMRRVRVGAGELFAGNQKDQDPTQSPGHFQN